jgi:hypothetical protein
VEGGASEKGKLTAAEKSYMSKIEKRVFFRRAIFCVDFENQQLFIFTLNLFLSVFLCSLISTTKHTSFTLNQIRTSHHHDKNSPPAQKSEIVSATHHQA